MNVLDLTLSKSEKPQLESRILFEFDKWEYELNANDWINTTIDLEKIARHIELQKIAFVEDLHSGE